MEPGVRQYLIRILNTLAFGMLWMALNMTAGIMYDLAFIHDHVRTANVLFYIGFITSFIAFIWWVIRTWSKPIDFEQ
jgi:hypothetical protein